VGGRTRLARPIVRLRDATHQIATTLDLSTPIDVEGGEVGDLASSFSTMVAQVGRSQEQQRRLVSDASHEMRTPLTSLRSNIELLRQLERLPEAERREVIGDVLEDIDELSALLGELVVLASDLTGAEPQEPLGLGDLARAVAARTQRRTDRVVHVDDTTAVNVVGRPRQLERAISNLVDNAVKYSAPATPVDIVVDATTVTVRDRGRGIPAEDVGRIFDRFYRAVDVRAESGSGLGLSIVDEIVRSHGGSVFARNRDGGGAEVGSTLPQERGRWTRRRHPERRQVRTPAVSAGWRCPAPPCGGRSASRRASAAARLRRRRWRGSTGCRAVVHGDEMATTGRRRHRSRPRSRSCSDARERLDVALGEAEQGIGAGVGAEGGRLERAVGHERGDPSAAPPRRWRSCSERPAHGWRTGLRWSEPHWPR
jgi:two-component sensor histidine kinase